MHFLFSQNIQNCTIQVENIINQHMKINALVAAVG